jgi:hypothetical protein
MIIIQNTKRTEKLTPKIANNTINKSENELIWHFSRKVETAKNLWKKYWLSLVIG